MHPSSLFPGLLPGLVPPPPDADSGLEPGLDPDPGFVPPGGLGLLVGGTTTTGLTGWAGSLGGGGGRGGRGGGRGGLTGGPATEVSVSVALVAESLQGAARWGKLQLSVVSSKTVPGGQLMILVRTVERDQGKC